MAIIQATRDYKLIYVFQLLNSPDHVGLLKVGEASVTVPESKVPEPNDPAMIIAANNRILQEVNVAGVQYKLLYTEVAYYIDSELGGMRFNDHDVHDVLESSGYPHHVFPWSTAREWFPITLDIAKQAIKAVKEQRQSLTAAPNSIPSIEIEFRKEQLDAIGKTLNHFKIADSYLWNAKMRFGKTLSALEVVRRMGCKRTLILTHRPVVRDGWFDDFELIKFENYQRGAKYRPGMSIPKGGIGQDLLTMEKDFQKEGTKYIYFMSVQDLRGSQGAGGKFNKNDDVFSTKWDLVIIDEAHEGTQTTLGKKVLSELKKKKPKFLYLSGTPYNILDQFSEGEIYTWDYVMEQKAKEDWYKNHPDKPNPYEGLPRLNMLTYDLGKAFENYQRTEEAYFNFREFFRVWEEKDLANYDEDDENIQVGDFVHKDDVYAFLELLTKEDPDSNYPFSNEEFRGYFNHSFWVVPGVKAAAALTTMLKKHHVFKDYGIVNVAGDGNKLAEEDEDLLISTVDERLEEDEKNIKDALDKVKTAIKSYKRTITISCGRLTTGITVPEWTAVFMLSGSYNTKAATYMQTIFRVQSPAKDGTIKKECYAFDFAPDRTITVVEEYLDVVRKLKEGKSGREAKVQDDGHHTDTHTKHIDEFLQFCPIIAVEGSRAVPFNTMTFVKQVNRAIADKIYRKGFDDARLFMNFNAVKKEDLEKLTGIESLFGKANAKTMSNEGVVVTDTGIKGPDKQQTSGETGTGGKKKGSTSGGNKERKNYLANLRRYRQLMSSITKRFPLLLFGAVEELDKDHWSLKEFVKSLQPEDWEQFMPKGFTQEKFLEVEHIFDNDYFISATQILLEEAHKADSLSVDERVSKMAHILQRFHYPDKETVLTPWRVVNLHMSTTIGGYSFFKPNKYDKELMIPEFIKNEDITDEIFAADSKLLEINSKSGVYPLWLAYTLFRYRCEEVGRDISDEKQQQIWDDILKEQLFVLCKTKMACRITERILAGYRAHVVTHCKYQDDLQEILKDEDKQNNLIKKLQTPSYWNLTDMANKQLFFKAVVGNPPYQGENHWQLYPNFYLLSQQLGKYSSLIFPVGWQQPKNANNLKLLNNATVKTDRQIVSIDNRQNIFQGVAGAEWVNIVFWQKDFDNGLDGKQKMYFNGVNEKIVNLPYNTDSINKPNEIRCLIECIKSKEGFVSMQSITSSRKPYGFSTDVLTDYTKYGLTPFYEEQISESDIKIYCKNNEYRWIPAGYNIPNISLAFQKYKVLIPYAWGNMSNNYLGGAFADIIIAEPNEICLETYLESGVFNDITTTRKHAKYLMTKFARAALFSQKVSQHSTTAWGNVPVQDYTEPWWDESVEQINEHLFDKYDVPQNVRDFVNKNIQPRSEENIRNM